MGWSVSDTGVLVFEVSRWLRDSAGKGTPGGHKTIGMVLISFIKHFPISHLQGSTSLLTLCEVSHHLLNQEAQN